MWVGLFFFFFLAYIRFSTWPVAAFCVSLDLVSAFRSFVFFTWRAQSVRNPCQNGGPVSRSTCPDLVPGSKRPKLHTSNSTVHIFDSQESQSVLFDTTYSPFGPNDMLGIAVSP